MAPGLDISKGPSLHTILFQGYIDKQGLSPHDVKKWWPHFILANPENIAGILSLNESEKKEA